MPKAQYTHVDNCKACQLVRTEAAGRKVNLSKFYQLCDEYAAGTKTLTTINELYPQLRYLGIRNHVLKHHAASELKIAKLKSKRAMRSTDRERLDALELEVRELKTNIQKRDAIIEKGMEGILAGDIKLSGATVVKALKDADDVEAKRTDQGMEMMKMFEKYQYGELSDFDAARGKIIDG